MTKKIYNKREKLIYLYFIPLELKVNYTNISFGILTIGLWFCGIPDIVNSSKATKAKLV